MPSATRPAAAGLRNWGTPTMTLLLLLGGSAAFNTPPPLRPPLRSSLLAMQVQQIPSPAELRAAVTASACEGGISVVLFGSKQCAACRALLPRTRRLAAARRDVRFFSLESSKATAEAFQYHEITAVPTFLVLDASGAILETRAGLALAEWPAFRSHVEALADSCDAWAA